MSFPYRDTLGEVYLDILSELNLIQRQKEFKDSVTPKEFLQHSQGKNFEQLNSELPPRTLIYKPIPIVVDGGVAAKFRYVEDPTEPGGVIDMLHFMNAARWPLGLGEQIGFAVELNQARKGDRSAFQRSDIRSNFYGAVFRNNYFDPNGDLNQQFQEFFTDLKNGELKGFAPTFEYFLDDVIDLAKDAQRALQQLQGRA